MVPRIFRSYIIVFLCLGENKTRTFKNISFEQFKKEFVIKKVDKYIQELFIKVLTIDLEEKIKTVGESGLGSTD